jgi:hypothetical protein
MNDPSGLIIILGDKRRSTLARTSSDQLWHLDPMPSDAETRCEALPARQWLPDEHATSFSAVWRLI